VPALDGDQRSFVDHRRALWYAGAFIAATVAVFVVVGIRPSRPPIQPFDTMIYHGVDDIRNAPLTFLAKVLNILGGGLVTIPLRIVVSIYLAFKRRWTRLGGWLLTWVLAEVTLTVSKAAFNRPRPPNPLVATTGASFPSGHAVATSAIAVGLVLALMAPGPRRRKWEIIAAVFAFVMALSRVYLNAHWFSDVVAGTLLGTGIAIASFAIAAEGRDVILRRRARRRGPAVPAPP
jgi:undecaprenyl-diphosphatase